MNDRIVAIAGAAGGLGPTVTRAFSQAGAVLALAGRDRAKLEALQGSLPGAAARITAVDLGDPDAARSWAGELVRVFGRVDVVLQLVGGYAGGSSLSELALGDWERMQGMLVKTTLCVVRAFAGPLAASKGRFVAVTSPKAQAPTARSAVYAMSKAASDALVLALADELRGTGATANLIVVDAIDAPEARDAGGAKPPARSTPAEQIAAAMLYLCSPTAAGINGARLPLTGK